MSAKAPFDETRSQRGVHSSLKKGCIKGSSGHSMREAFCNSAAFSTLFLFCPAAGSLTLQLRFWQQSSVIWGAVLFQHFQGGVPGALSSDSRPLFLVVKIFEARSLGPSSHFVKPLQAVLLKAAYNSRVPSFSRFCRSRRSAKDIEEVQGTPRCRLLRLLQNVHTHTGL